MNAPLRPSFWEELRRRRVVRAVAVYAVAAWVVVQVADVFFPALRMPGWTVTLVAALAVLGFPATVALAWIFDRTPEGVRRTDAPDPAGQAAGRPDRAADPRELDGPTPGPPSPGPEPGRRPSGAAPASHGRLLLALILGVALGVGVVGAGLWAAGGTDRDDPVPAEDAPARPVIAVLPFESVGEANAMFTEGIHGYVLTGLSGTEGLDVISRGSVLRYGNVARPASEIAADLGVQWVLRGEVQQVAEEVRVHARLVDASTDRQVWAEAYAGRLSAANLFDIQSEITAEIVGAIETRLGRGVGGGGQTGTTDDLDAYRLYAQGRGLLVRRTEPAMRAAAESFREAIQRDSGYAAAWAGLADALTYLETFGFPTNPDITDARSAAQHALDLDPDLAEAHFALANLAHADRDDPEAVRRARNAARLRPSYSDAWNLLSWIYRQHGRAEQALAAARRAVELDPLGSAPLSNLALAHLALGNPAAAMEPAREIRRLRPEFSTGPFIEGLALYHQGRYQDASQVLRDIDVAWAPDAPDVTRALTSIALGDSAEARATLDRLDTAAHPFSASLIQLALGEDRDAALRRIQRIEQWDYWPVLAARFLFPQHLGPLRSDPSYGGIRARIDQSWGGPLPD